MKIKKTKIVFLIVILILIIFFIITFEYTSHAKFCPTCHYMKPFYESWQLSKHNEVECALCHYPPGLKAKLNNKLTGLVQMIKYLTKDHLGSKPMAEIPDESCLRPGCHEKKLISGEINFKTVIFDHESHLKDLKRGKRLRCTSCHSQIVQGEHIIVTEETCFICHFKENEHYPNVGECTICHHKDILVSEKEETFNHTSVFQEGLECVTCHSETVQGDGAVPIENCYNCHWETDRLNKYDDTDFMHKTHIADHKIECLLCHLPIKHEIFETEMIEGAPIKCSNCHTSIANEVANSKHSSLTCDQCHKAPKEHILSPEQYHPTKPDSRDFCISCHNDKATHKEGKLCWTCHDLHRINEGN